MDEQQYICGNYRVADRAGYRGGYGYGNHHLHGAYGLH